MGDDIVVRLRGPAPASREEAAHEIERLRRVILRRIRDDNECQPAPGRCTGWDAKQCGCAEEARNAYAAQL